MKYLPPTSKHREADKEDIVQTFDPARHHGANQPRFLNYINLCRDGDAALVDVKEDRIYAPTGDGSVHALRHPDGAF